jgi:hypothetical protein
VVVAVAWPLEVQTRGLVAWFAKPQTPRLICLAREAADAAPHCLVREEQTPRLVARFAK